MHRDREAQVCRPQRKNDAWEAPKPEQSQWCTLTQLLLELLQGNKQHHCLDVRPHKSMGDVLLGHFTV